MNTQVVDPWLFSSNNGMDHLESPKLHEFDDDFKPFVKMPDSNSYLAILEKRLRKLRGDPAHLTGRGMVEVVEKTKLDHMTHFLNGLTTGSGLMDQESPHVIETRSDLSVPNIVKLKLYPDKFALNAEELQHLLSADQLNVTNESHLCNNNELNDPSPINKNRYKLG